MFTYNPDELSTSLLFQVRLMTGLTSATSILTMSDEEILFLLDMRDGDVRQTSIDVINSLLSRALEFTDKTTGQVSESMSQILGNLFRLRDDLENSFSRSVPTYAQFTGVFIDDMEEVLSDPEIFHDTAVRRTTGAVYAIRTS